MRQRPLNWKKSVVWTRFYYDCIKAINTPASHRLLLWCLQLTSFLTHDLQQTISSNTGIGEFFGCICDTLEKTVSARKRDTTQYSTAKLCQHGSAHASRHGTWKKLQIDRVFTTLSKLRFWCSYSHFLSIFVANGDFLWIFVVLWWLQFCYCHFARRCRCCSSFGCFCRKCLWRVVRLLQLQPVPGLWRSFLQPDGQHVPCPERTAHLQQRYGTLRYSHYASSLKSVTERSGTLIMLLQWSQSQNALALSSCFFNEVSHRTLRYSHYASSLKSVTERSGTLIMLLHWSQLRNAQVLLSYFFTEVSYGTLRYSYHASSLKSITERSCILIILQWSQSQNAQVLWRYLHLGGRRHSDTLGFGILPQWIYGTFG